MWVFFSIFTVFNICNSLPNWDLTKPTIETFLKDGRLSMEGYRYPVVFSSHFILQKSNDWTIVDYTFGPHDEPDKYKAHIIIHYLRQHNLETIWDFFIFPLSVGTRITNTLWRRITEQSPSHRIDNLIGMGAKTIEVTIVSNKLSARAHIDGLGATESVDVYQKVNNKYVPIGTQPRGFKTGTWAMKAIMQLLLRKLEITDIALDDASGRECAQALGSSNSVPYAVWNAYQGRKGYYHQWYFDIPYEHIKQQEQDAIEYVRKTPVSEIFAACINEQKKENIKGDIFPTFKDFATYIIALDLSKDVVIGDFMNRIYGINCVAYHRWYQFFRECGSVHSIEVHGFLSDPIHRKFDESHIEDVLIISAHKEKSNYLDCDDDDKYVASKAHNGYKLYKNYMYHQEYLLEFIGIICIIIFICCLCGVAVFTFGGLLCFAKSNR